MAVNFPFFAAAGAAWELVSPMPRLPGVAVVGECGRSNSLPSVLAGVILKWFFG